MREFADRTDLHSLVQEILALPRADIRHAIAIAGPPTSGKSTFSERLACELREAGRETVSIPMDGFHLDNRLLADRGLLDRKGAPETFDVHGFIALVDRVKSEPEVFYPGFDRDADVAIANAHVVRPSCDIALFEGNYLLFDEEPWNILADRWTISVWLDVSTEEVVQRATSRWLNHGMSADDAAARANGNDLANARTVMRQRLPSDYLMSTR